MWYTHLRNQLRGLQCVPHFWVYFFMNRKKIEINIYIYSAIVNFSVIRVTDILKLLLPYDHDHNHSCRAKSKKQYKLGHRKRGLPWNQSEWCFFLLCVFWNMSTKVILESFMTIGSGKLSRRRLITSTWFRKYQRGL